ncbi:MAG: hypothetical protein H5T84_07970, partial [Thermoleophilia bacterium]|nr:hypothetical protein [Thermoleophilia bacterium]
MIILGLDVGSRTVDAVWWDTKGPEPGGRVVHSAVVASGFDPQEVCSRLAALHRYDRLVTTGYGRHAAAVNLDGVAVTEISAFARGAAFLFPGARS